ncbi:ribonuclease H-like domain-containing protein [Tanacetum coccineum]
MTTNIRIFSVRINILITDPIPDVKLAFDTLSRDESHRNSNMHDSKSSSFAFIARSNNDWFRNRNNKNRRFIRGPSTNLVCKHGNMTGHTIKRFFELVGYPPRFKKNPQVNNLRLPLILCLLVILVLSLVGNVIDVSHLDITVSHPKGTVAKVNEIGSFKLTETLIIHDVLVVHGYHVTLLSVHKVASVNKRDRNTKDDGTKLSFGSDIELETNLDDAEGSADHFASTIDKDVPKTSLSNEENIDPLGNRIVDGQPEDVDATSDDDKLQDYELDGKVKYGLNKYVNYVNLTSKTCYFVTNLNKKIEPKTYKEASTDSRWVEAMNNEMEALKWNNTWVISDLPKGRIPIGCKYIYMIEYKANGEVERYKARLVAKGYSQKEGIDYEENFTPGCKYASTPIEINPNKPNLKIINKKDYPFAMDCYMQPDLKLAFRGLRYLKGTPEKRVFYKKDDKFALTAFKQYVLAKSSVEAEYRVMSNVACEIIWILKLLTNLKVDYTIPFEMFCDSNAAMQIAANPVFHKRTKHFEIDLYFLREKIAERVFKTSKIQSEFNTTHVLTKGLSSANHKRMCDMLNLVNVIQVCQSMEGLDAKMYKVQGP